jgi:hypothetical protein
MSGPLPKLQQNWGTHKVYETAALGCPRRQKRGFTMSGTLDALVLVAALAAGILWELVKVRKTPEECLKMLKQKR